MWVARQRAPSPPTLPPPPPPVDQHLPGLNPVPTTRHQGPARAQPPPPETKAAPRRTLIIRHPLRPAAASTTTYPSSSPSTPNRAATPTQSRTAQNVHQTAVAHTPPQQQNMDTTVSPLGTNVTLAPGTNQPSTPLARTTAPSLSRSTSPPGPPASLHCRSAV